MLREIRTASRAVPWRVAILSFANVWPAHGNIVEFGGLCRVITAVLYRNEYTVRNKSFRWKKNKSVSQTRWETNGSGRS
ncbi:hypothetical protein BD410DRAFT_789790 [Rickenella mellea]|uniref:Uncharacterized protein n=1 Tax=Rickenella mellea TaxID=50990 RepID=A0A4Y7Q135_9AGAM|nr:hypothetical protein BD410DRAFT_789790 [Rickenella mellea]